MARDEERVARAQQEPIVGGLPDVPGIGPAMRLTPGLGVHLRGLADEVLVNDFPGATLRRDQREILATAVSAANDCFFCMDSHGAFVAALLEKDGAHELMPLIDTAKAGSSDGFDPKMQALLHIARTVRRDALALSDADVNAAHDAGATDADVQLAVLIASAFSMYNRLVDGFRARTAPTTEAYRTRAAEIAENGYSAPSTSASAPTPGPTAAPSPATTPA
jgi:AhpD family alkylhydroperoxidase